MICEGNFAWNSNSWTKKILLCFHFSLRWSYLGEMGIQIDFLISMDHENHYVFYITKASLCCFYRRKVSCIGNVLCCVKFAFCLLTFIQWYQIQAGIVNNVFLVILERNWFKMSYGNVTQWKYFDFPTIIIIIGGGFLKKVSCHFLFLYIQPRNSQATSKFSCPKSMPNGKSQYMHASILNLVSKNV